MQDTFLISILPYTVMAGLAVSAIASIGLVTNAFLHTRSREIDPLPRLSELEAVIRRDTARIDMQLHQLGRGFKSDTVRSVVGDLSLIAAVLQKRASEAHRIIDELRSDEKIGGKIENRKRFVDLGLAVGQTEISLESVVTRIEQKNKRYKLL